MTTFTDFGTKASNPNGGFGAEGIYAKTVLNGSASINPANLVDGTGHTVTITVTGAAVGDFAMIAPGEDLQGLIVTAYVSAADTVSIRIQNETTVTVNLGPSIWKAKVIKDAL